MTKQHRAHSQRIASMWSRRFERSGVSVLDEPNLPEGYIPPCGQVHAHGPDCGMPTYPPPPPPPPPQVAIPPIRAVTKTRKDTSHLFHLIMTILTGGLWGFVWLWMILWHKGGPRRKTVTRTT